MPQNETLRGAQGDMLGEPRGFEKALAVIETLRGAQGDMLAKLRDFEKALVTPLNASG